MPRYIPPTELSPTDKLIWLFIKLNQRESHSVRALGKSLGLANDTVARSLQRMRVQGFIEITQQGRPGLPSHYKTNKRGKSWH